MATKLTYKVRSGGKWDVGSGTRPTQTFYLKKYSQLIQRNGTRVVDMYPDQFLWLPTLQNRRFVNLLRLTKNTSLFKFLIRGLLYRSAGHNFNGLYFNIYFLKAVLHYPKIFWNLFLHRVGLTSYGICFLRKICDTFENVPLKCTAAELCTVEL